MAISKKPTTSSWNTAKPAAAVDDNFTAVAGPYYPVSADLTQSVILEISLIAIPNPNAQIFTPLVLRSFE